MRPILSLISTVKIGSVRLYRSSLDAQQLENRFGPLLLPLIKKTPAAFLSIAFVYLAACNFDPFWMAHDAESEVITAPRTPGQLQTCNPASLRNLPQSLLKDARPGALVRNGQRAAAESTAETAANPCLPPVSPSVELSYHARPFAHPLAMAPPDPRT